MKRFEGRTLFLWLILSTLTFAEPKSHTAFTTVQICKAAISSIMGVEVEAIHTKQRDNGTVHLYYRIENKKSRYGYKCKLDGEKVIWGTAMARWRTQQDDAVITYSVKEGHVTIKERFRDEPESEATYTTFSLAKL